MLTNDAVDALGAISSCVGLDALTRALGSYLAKRELHTFSSALITPADEESGTTVSWATNASDDYGSFYFDNDYAADDYGIRVHVEERRTRPFAIGHAQADRMPGLRAAEAGFYRAAADWGYRSGMVLPNFTATASGVLPSGFSVWSEDAGPAFRAMRAEHEAEIALVLFSAQAKLLPALAPEAGPLTRRERECLSYAASGLRPDGIADTLCLATVTVRVHLAQARRKLDAATLPEAVAKAMRAGMIGP